MHLDTLRAVFKSVHSGGRFQKFAVSACVFTGYVWTGPFADTINGAFVNPDIRAFGNLQRQRQKTKLLAFLYSTTSNYVGVVMRRETDINNVAV